MIYGYSSAASYALSIYYFSSAIAAAPDIYSAYPSNADNAAVASVEGVYRIILS